MWGCRVRSLLKRRSAVRGLTAIGISADSLAVVRAWREPGRKPVVDVYDVHPLAGEETARVLARLVTRYQLKRATCTTVLNLDDYKLLLTEAPDVRAEELRAALRWRLKDLIDFHVNDAAIDAFDLPQGSGSGQGRSMFAVVAQNRVIRERVGLLQAAAVHLDIIDIPELSQRNVAALTPEDVSGVAFVSLTDRAGLITITRQGELYFSRTLDLGTAAWSAGDPAVSADRLVLEVQRSLDYFDSHFRQSPVAHLLLDPVAASVPSLVTHLAANLNVRVGSWDPRTTLDWQVEVPAQPWLAVLGAALREEQVVL